MKIKITFLLVISTVISFSQNHYKSEKYFDEISIYGIDLSSDAIIGGYYNLSSIKNNFHYNLNVNNHLFVRKFNSTLISNNHNFFKEIKFDSIFPCKILIQLKNNKVVVQAIFIDNFLDLGVIDTENDKILFYTNGKKLICYIKKIIPKNLIEGIQDFCNCKK
jgi:hypothetical protein